MSNTIAGAYGLFDSFNFGDASLPPVQYEFGPAAHALGDGVDFPPNYEDKKGKEGGTKTIQGGDRPIRVKCPEGTEPTVGKNPGEVICRKGDFPILD